MKSNTFLKLFVAGAVLVGAPIQPQAAVPNCEKEPACMTLWNRAGELSKQGNLAQSQRMYEMAYDLRADPRLLFNIARVLHKRGLLADAAAHYESFLRGPLEDEEQKAKARVYLSEIRAAAPLGTASRTEQTPAEPDPAPGMKLQPALPAPATAPSDGKPVAQPLYKKWWLWTTVAVVAAGAVGLGLGLSLGRPRDPFVEGAWR